MSRQAGAPPVLPLGTRVAGRYVVLRVLGQGGMGQVFEVEHEAIGRRFALKILNLSPCTEEVLRRFQREARALGRVTTPRVAQVSDFGYEPDVGPYYVMELLDGETLEDRLEREIRIPVAQVVALGVELAEALHEVHSAGVVHRDLKPSNVGLCRAGAVRVKLLDFGLAAATDEAMLDRITRSQEVVGSLPYMAPERFNNAPPSPSVDLYALGVVLYEALTGRLPYDGQSAAGVINAHLNVTPPSFAEAAPGLPVPAAIEAVVGRLLAKDPRDRFVSALAAARALGAAGLDPATPTLDETAAEAVAPTFYAPEPDDGGRTIEDPRPPGAATSPGPFGPPAGAAATLPAVPATYLASGPVSRPPSSGPTLVQSAVGPGQVPATLCVDPGPAPGRAAPSRGSGPPGGVWTTGQAVPPATLPPPAGPVRGRTGLLVAVVAGAALLAALAGGAVVALIATDRGGHGGPAAPTPAVRPAAPPPVAVPPAAAAPDAGAPARPDAGARAVAPRRVVPSRTGPRETAPPPPPPPVPPRRPPAGEWDGGVIFE